MTPAIPSRPASRFRLSELRSPFLGSCRCASLPVSLQPEQTQTVTNSDSSHLEQDLEILVVRIFRLRLGLISSLVTVPAAFILLNSCTTDSMPRILERGATSLGNYIMLLCNDDSDVGVETRQGKVRDATRGTWQG
jgi:hypothetical protein